MYETDRTDGLRRQVSDARSSGRSIGLVPTMGYLHEGHLRLIDAARSENEYVVCSVYVNPTQFGPNEDLDRYPRDLQKDRSLANEHGVDLLFVPSTETMYPNGPRAQYVWVDPGQLTQYLDGASRPGHFRGVATVVTKLFHMVQPDRAYFGQKDAQQAVVVQRMARDLAFPIEIRVVPTVREEDGLALSSRNVYLSPEERLQAPALYHALRRTRAVIERGERRVSRIEREMSSLIQQEAPSAHVDFIAVADLQTLQPAGDLLPTEALIALAVYFGSTRLIDNLMVRCGENRPEFQ
ncbi:MAG TPA: pantoate--beta-alanine ligase [Chloroflexota bacterium]